MEPNTIIVDELKEKAEEQLIQQPKADEWFKIGALIGIAGYVFRVKSVKPKELRLKLVGKVKSK